MGISTENDNDEVNRVLRMWTDMARLRTKTLIISHHQRKEGGDFGDSVSGAQAWTRVPDVILDLRVEQGSRYLTSRGRYPSPDSIYYDKEFNVVGKPEGSNGSKNTSDLSPKECESCGDSFLPLRESHVLCVRCFRSFH